MIILFKILFLANILTLCFKEILLPAECAANTFQDTFLGRMQFGSKLMCGHLALSLCLLQQELN